MPETIYEVNSLICRESVIPAKTKADSLVEADGLEVSKKPAS